MSPRPSLTFRLIAYLLAAQIASLAIGWTMAVGLVLGGFRPWNGRIDDFAMARTKKLLIASLVRADDGTLRLEPTAALREEMRRAPSLAVAAYDPARKSLAPGSAPELAPVLNDTPIVSPVAMDFFLTVDGERRAIGFLDTLHTPAGEVRLAIYGERLRWDDPFVSFADNAREWGTFAVAAVLMGSVVTFLAVRRGLAPLRSVADAATKIDMSRLNQRLPESGVPMEIAPLVGAFNDALARLDAGVARLRRFTANAAHELRTPLAVLSARLGAPEEATFRRDLKRDVRRARTIVDQLLATARLSDQATEAYREIDLAAVAKSVASDAAMLAIRHGRQLAFDAPSKPVRVSGNHLALESVIANLVDNALRAEPEGGLVEVRVTSDATVSVIDHGAGVAECERETIFEPFWRKAEDTPGAGLGLAIARELIEKHDGHVWVEETPGGGATFRLWLPPISPT